MIELKSLDPSVSFADQLEDNSGPVTLVNMFLVPEGAKDDAMKKWREDAEFMRAQPGYISSQLHEATGGSRLMVNIAVWETNEALMNAFSDPQFQAKHDAWPEGTVVFPHLFKKVAVSGICVA